MTNEQKKQIEEMRRQGCGYAKIASQLSLSNNTVKSYCQRNALGAATLKAAAVCKQCGKPITVKAHCKPRLFCSDKCRGLWWKGYNHHSYPKTIYHLVCKHCGSAFESAGNRSRKYCSHDCYIAARFGKERDGDE